MVLYDIFKFLGGQQFGQQGGQWGAGQQQAAQWGAAQQGSQWGAQGGQWGPGQQGGQWGAQGGQWQQQPGNQQGWQQGQRGGNWAAQSAGAGQLYYGQGYGLRFQAPADV